MIECLVCYMEAATYLKYMVEISTLVGIVLVMSTLTCDAFLRLQISPVRVFFN